jgi:hypothetical protein
VVIEKSFPQGSWQSIRLIVNLSSASYDVYSAQRGFPLVQVAAALPFRGGYVYYLDQITVARFDVFRDASAYFDNFSVEIPGAPQFIRFPRSVLSSSCTNLTGIAVGTPPLSYQWFFHDAPIPGATNTTVINCGYPYYLRVTNNLGVAYSDTVTIIDNTGLNFNSSLYPYFQNGMFGFWIKSLSGFQYVTEFKTQLSASAWTPISTNIGNGGGSFSSGFGFLFLGGTNVLAHPSGFYRVSVSQ